MTDPIHPLRSKFLDLESDKKVLTNHFEYTLHATELFEYKISSIGSKDKRIVKGVYEAAIAAWAFLNNNTVDFATNHYDAIVSWRNLHGGITNDLVDGDGVSKGKWKMTVLIGTKTMDAHFELIRKFNTSTLLDYSNAEPSAEKENFDSASRCLNLLISKSFDDTQIHRHAANKFFVKDARRSLGFDGNFNDPSSSLEIVRGYYYTVKPGMGNIILNFNLATSAFFRPIMVKEFMDDVRTFPYRQEEHMRGLRVQITTARKKNPGDKTSPSQNDSRSKKITGLSKTKIGDLMFYPRLRKADGKYDKHPNGSYKTSDSQTRVVDYIKSGTFG